MAAGFTFMENFVNQMIDLLDANSIHEQLIPLLSNLLNLKLIFLPIFKYFKLLGNSNENSGTP